MFDFLKLHMSAQTAMRLHPIRTDDFFKDKDVQTLVHVMTYNTLDAAELNPDPDGWGDGRFGIKLFTHSFIR